MSTKIVSAKKISHKLERLAIDLLALHNFSRMDLEGEREYFVAVVETIAKAGVRTLDACIQKLGGTPLGNFECEFEEEELELP